MRLPTRRSLLQYAMLGVINSLLVYLVYTPYVFLWVGFTVPQYVKWLEGGIAYSLMTGWFFAFAIIRVKKKFFPESGNGRKIQCGDCGEFYPDIHDCSKPATEESLRA